MFGRGSGPGLRSRFSGVEGLALLCIYAIGRRVRIACFSHAKARAHTISRRACISRSHAGCAPLHLAAKKGALKAVRALVRHGADLHLKSEDGEVRLPFWVGVWCRVLRDGELASTRMVLHYQPGDRDWE